MYLIWRFVNFELSPIVQYKNFLLGILATVASTASNAKISSADTTLPLRFKSSREDSLKACARIYNSSIMKRLLDKSKSFKLGLKLITSANFSATSEESLLLPTWTTLRFLLSNIASASFKPAKSSKVLLLSRNSFKFFTLETNSYIPSAAYELISF